MPPGVSMCVRACVRCSYDRAPDQVVQSTPSPTLTIPVYNEQLLIMTSPTYNDQPTYNDLPPTHNDQPHV